MPYTEEEGKPHPEQREGEVWYTNISLNEERMRAQGLFIPIRELGEDRQTAWEHISWRTKRRGNVAYDLQNNILLDHCPVFVQRSEMEAAGVNPESFLEAMIRKS